MKPFIVILILCMFSCHQSESYEQKMRELNANNKNSKNELTYDKSMLINVVENSNCHEGKHIGFTGEVSFTYKCYERLSEMCSDSEWLEFSDSKSAVMKAYAYDALLEKNSKLAEIVKRRLLLDTSTLCFVSNDMSENLSLREYVKYRK